MKKLLLVLLIIVVSKYSYGIDKAPILFGPEFTFSNEQLSQAEFFGDDLTPEGLHRTNKIINRILNKYVDHLKQHLIDGQPDGAKFAYIKKNLGEVEGEGEDAKYYFISPEGWKFCVDYDSGVVEVTMDPLTWEVYKEFSSNINDAIFVSAHNAGLIPYEYLGGGHINIGMQAFRYNPILLRNFIVDFINHAELSMGILNYDTNNALPYWQLTELQMKEFRRVISEFDRGVYSELGTNTFLEDIQSAVNRGDADSYFLEWRNPSKKRSKHHALNFDKSYYKSTLTVDSLRLEIRSVRPQKDIDVFLRQTELFKKRIEYLKQIFEPIPIKSELMIKRNSPRKDLLKPPVNPQEALRAFYRYVTESGLNWRDHRDYIWPEWIQKGELRKFEKSIDCKGLLSI